MNVSKKWVLIVLVSLSILLTFSAFMVIYIDPFFQYHKPLNDFIYDINNEAYQNAGLAKSFEYESLITGSSMTQNFKTSWFKNEKTIKLSFANAFPRTGNIIISCALEQNPDLRKVYWGIDIFNFIRDTMSTGQDLPLYLYDNNYFNDVNYIWNNDVLFKWIPNIIYNTKIGKEPVPWDEIYCWDSGVTFSEKETLLNAGSSGTVYTPEQAERACENMQLWVLPLIEAHPEIEFNIFFPPYSILCWRQTDDVIDNNITLAKEMIELLFKYPNVKVFYFQNQEEIIGNLYLYKDWIHYNGDVNEFMAQAFQNDQCLLTNENYQDELHKMSEIAKNFDYTVFDSEGTLKEVEDLNYYFHLLENKEYVLIAVADTIPETNYVSYYRNIFQNYGFSDSFINPQNITMNIIDSGKLIYEESASHKAKQYYNYDNLNIEIRKNSSDSWNDGIWINGVRYAYNKSNINFIVYDKVLQRVVDSASISETNMKIER